MIVATKGDKDDIVEMLTGAFLNNKSVNYIVGRAGDRKQMRALMDYSFEICKMFGEVYITEDRQGCALILYPQQKRFALRAVWLDLKLILNAVGILNINKALRREAAIKKLQPRLAMMYLWFIGVSPEHQHQGIGTNMMRDIIQISEAKNLPVYLETSTLENISWYSKFGFQNYNVLDLSYSLYFLRR